MARRASSGVNPQALLIGAALIILVLGGGYWFINRSSAGFDAPPLDLTRDVDSLKSLAGNKNSVTGTLIDRRIIDEGQMAIVKAEGGHSLAIKIPDNFKGGNLNLQHEYTFLVEFNNDGIAVALDVNQL